MIAPVRLAPSYHERIWGIPWPDPPYVGKNIGEAWFTTDPPLPILPKISVQSQRLPLHIIPILSLQNCC